MNDARGEGKGTKSRVSRARGSGDKEIQQIEYFLYQSTQGVHFMFQSSDIRRVLMRTKSDTLPKNEVQEDFFNLEVMDKVQELLAGWLDRVTLVEKRSFLESLPEQDFELLIRAYFHLVENTILAQTDLKH